MQTEEEIKQVLIEVGNKVKLQREQKGLTVAQLGHKARISASRLLAIENGDVDCDISRLHLIATSLNCSVRDFL